MKPKKEILDSILDDNEKLAVQMFVDNDVQREAVKKVLLMGIYHNGTLEKGKDANPFMNFALGHVAAADELHLDNNALGQQLRAAWEGIVAIEKGFEGMNYYRKPQEGSTKKDNPAV
jgi:hypothetical protein